MIIFPCHKLSSPWEWGRKGQGLMEKYVSFARLPVISMAQQSHPNPALCHHLALMTSLSLYS